MSAYVIVEFLVRDPDLSAEKYACTAGQTANDETVMKWLNSPEYQPLIDVRGAATDARFSLLGGLPN